MRDTPNSEREQLREEIANATAGFMRGGGKTVAAKQSARKHEARTFTPLEQETRTGLPTEEAAHHLNRKKQTLHVWACKENGPIRPVRINGRLVWLVADIKRVLSGEVAK